MWGENKLHVAILWHMHQPFYFNPDDNRFDMPWVRFHALKDYLDMPLMASQYDNVKVTFNLVPSLIDQIDMYCSGCTDRHLELSRIPARDLAFENKKEILESFFSVNHPTMLDPFIRYRQLYRKKESCGTNVDLAVEIFSTSEWRDLQVWSNLAWIDPMFRTDEPVKRLFEKGKDYEEEDKQALLDYELDLMGRIIPTYKKLYSENKIDLSFTPYYHPILPLLVNTDSALESIPDMELPENNFTHPEDARWHLEQSAAKFKKMFGDDLTGLWPSEGSVSEEVLKLIESTGVKWAATDEEILVNSLLKSGLSPATHSPHRLYSYKGAPGVKLFFRDRGLSDRIGFVYSGWDADKAVSDFMQHLRQIKNLLKDDLDNHVVPIILDGENAWEYFPDDGREFLETLYKALAEDDQIEAVSCRDAAEHAEPVNLPSLFAGSWINHNFRIWIGHSEDNAAWDLLYDARKALVEYEEKNPDADSEKTALAWKQIHIAEGSDWCWWYGDDHIGAFNAQFDTLFRKHLMTMYRLINLDPPSILGRPIHRGKVESFISQPESLVTPQLDGMLTHYYEWTGAGYYDCRRAGGAMHRTDHLVAGLYFAFDYEHFYIRLDFTNQFNLVEPGQYRIRLDFGDIGHREFDPAEECDTNGGFFFKYDHILEVRIPRKELLDNGGGEINFHLSIFAGEELVERWPPDDPIVLNIPEKDKEIFWQV